MNSALLKRSTINFLRLRALKRCAALCQCRGESGAVAAVSATTELPPELPRDLAHNRKMSLYGRSQRPEYHHRGPRTKEDRMYDMAYWAMTIYTIVFGGYCARTCWSDFAPSPEDCPDKAYLAQKEKIRFH